MGNVFEISFKNVGKVSAVAPWLNEEFIFWKKGMELPHFSGCPKTKRFNYGEVIPDQVVPFRPPAINISLTREQIAALESTSQTAGLFIHVCVHYGTVLTNIEGVTEYCTVAYQLSRTETVPCLGNPDILK